MSKQLTKSEQIAQTIRKMIKTGNYTSGSKLPTERALAEDLQTSQLTVSKAISMLVAEGIVYKRQGSGNFVTEKKVASASSQLSVCFLIGELLGSPNPVWHAIYDAFFLALAEADIDVRPIVLRTDSILTEEAIGNADVVVSALSLGQERVDSILALKRPVIWLDEYSSDLPGATVCFDNTAAGYMAAEHLIDRGCKRFLYMTHPVVFFNNPRDYTPSIRRFEGFQKGIRDLTANAGQLHYYTCLGDFSNFVPELQFYLKHPDTIDGILCFSDSLMPYAVKAAMVAERCIPDDLKLIGIDGWSICDTFIPTLTTLRQPTEQIGKKAAELIMEYLDSQVLTGIYKFKPELIEHESTQMG